MREIKFRAWEYTVVAPGWEDKSGDVPGVRVMVLENGYKQHGYLKRKTFYHPYADKRGYVMEHRLIMEAKMGRFLPKNAVIHHKNGVRDDNRIENLEYMIEQERHAKSHDTGKRNPNGHFVATDPIFAEIKFRLLNKNTGLVEIHTLGKLIATTYRRSQFEFRGRFTGLKDKNGKEIYEGDILGYPNKNIKKVVEFGEYYFGGDEYGERGIGFYLQPYKYGVKSNIEAEIYDFPCIRDEIIGNIYENPELLKE